MESMGHVCSGKYVLLIYWDNKKRCPLLVGGSRYHLSYGSAKFLPRYVSVVMSVEAKGLSYPLPSPTIFVQDGGPRTPALALLSLVTVDWMVFSVEQEHLCNS